MLHWGPARDDNGDGKKVTPGLRRGIKALTGGDPITARFMRQDFFTFTPAFKLTVIGNHKPILRNVDDAGAAAVQRGLIPP